LLEFYKYDDPSAADIISYGAEVEGWLEGRPSWPPQTSSSEPQPAEVILAEAAKSREAVLASIKPSAHDSLLWESSVDDVREGRMRGPFSSVSDLLRDLGSDSCLIMRRFAVQQPDKIRPCDDGRSSGANRVTAQRTKVVLSSVDRVAAHARFAACLFPGQTIEMWKRDHKSAYRQVPLTPSARRFAVIAFCDPQSRKISLWYHLCLPFGLTAAVVEYNRVSQALTFLANRAFWIPCDSFFDDFWSIEPEVLAQDSFQRFGFLNDILGLSLKIEKDLHPATHCEVLGHGILLGLPPFFFFPTESRTAKTRFLIQKALWEDWLSPSDSASLAGKTNFTQNALYGKIGRAACKPLYARAHSTARQHPLSPALRAALEWLDRSFEWAPRRRIRMGPSDRTQVRALVDASGRGKIGAGWLGAVISTAPSEPPYFTAWRMPEHVFAWLKPRGNYIQFLEMSAAILLMATFPDILRDSDTVLFCDNTAQEGALTKGFSSSWDMAVVAGLFWELAGRLDCDVFIKRVESSFNIADCPSRPFDPDSAFILGAIGAVWREPANMDLLIAPLEHLAAQDALQDPDPARKRTDREPPHPKRPRLT